MKVVFYNDARVSRASDCRCHRAGWKSFPKAGLSMGYEAPRASRLMKQFGLRLHGNWFSCYCPVVKNIARTYVNGGEKYNTYLREW